MGCLAGELATYDAGHAHGDRALTADEIVGCDDVAFVRGTYAITVHGSPDTAPQDDEHTTSA